MEHLIDKYLKKPEYIKELFNKKVSISLKVDGSAFQISYDRGQDKVTYHKRGGSSKSLGPIIDEYTQLMRKNINDAIEYFDNKKDILKEYKFYAIEMFNDSYILLTVIDNDNNIIDNVTRLKEISKSLNIDYVPILFNGKLNKEQIESLLSMMTLGSETSNDTYKEYLTNIFGNGEYQKFLNGDEVEGIVLTWNTDNKIEQYKIINPAFKTRHDKEIKTGNEEFKKEMEELRELFEFLYDSLNEFGKHYDDNWIKTLNENFLYMNGQNKFKEGLKKFDNSIKPKFKDFFTLQENRVDKRIKKLIDEYGDNMKFYYEKYLSLFNKPKKRNFIISKEFQTKVNNLIERLQSKNESLKSYMKHHAKSLSDYIYEGFKLGKNYKNPYNYHPKDKDELKDIIEKLVDERGNEANLNDIDTSNILVMDFLFMDSKFNGDISGWDVSNVTSMRYTFANSEYSGKNGSLENWDISNVKYMDYMFANSQFDGDLSNWNVSNVKSMGGMFLTSKFDGDISGWNVSKVKCMSHMFKGSPLERNEPKWYANR